jgi:hypothetical protein
MFQQNPVLAQGMRDLEEELKQEKQKSRHSRKKSEKYNPEIISNEVKNLPTPRARICWIDFKLIEKGFNTVVLNY